MAGNKLFIIFLLINVNTMILEQNFFSIFLVLTEATLANFICVGGIVLQTIHGVSV